MESEIAILDYEHVGIRVSDKRRAQSFYEGMGFRLVGDHPEHKALILTNAAGITINLIYNAVARERNILMDEAEKYLRQSIKMMTPDRRPIQALKDLADQKQVTAKQGRRLF